VLALAQEFGFDVAELSTGDAERMVTDMREALADPVFADATPPVADLRLVASNAPALARAFLELHRAYAQGRERLASLDEALGRDGARMQASPWDEVRDFFHYCDNYIDAVDRAAEHFVRGGDPQAATLAALGTLGIRVEVTQSHQVRGLDREAGRLALSTYSPASTRRFQLLHQVALLTQNDLLEATLDLARFQSVEARSIAKIGLANYFAGAALLPYARFIDAARTTRHDLERLADLFGASIEQVAHRLSTMQRPGAKGIRASRSSSCASIRPARSPSATPPRGCNLPVSVVPARCGTSTAPLRRQRGSCASLPRRRMACAISRSRATCRKPAAASPRRPAASPSRLGAR